MVAVALLTSWAAFVLGPLLEERLFANGFLHWWQRDLAMEYDQRNCLVVGFAMGFAVVPLIFTICEDALSSVPSIHLRAGSLALGATRWQTAIRVVLPMALPGHLLCLNDRLWQGYWRDDDCPDGNGQYAGIGLGSIQWDAHDFRQYCRGTARGTSPGDALPRSLPKWFTSFSRHVCH